MKKAMPYIINDACIACGGCIDSCPNNAIIEGEDKYEITDDCVECGACLDSCPENAIKEI